MHAHRIFLVLLFAAASCPIYAAAVKPARRPAGESQLLSLKSAIHQGVKNATAILKAAGNDELAAIQVARNYSRFLPNLMVNSGYSAFQGNSTAVSAALFRMNSSSSVATYGISSSINIFNGFSDHASLEAALDRQKGTALTLARVREQIALDIEQTFLQIILDQQLEKIAKENLRISEEVLNFIQAKNSNGSAIAADLYRQRAQIANDKLVLAQAENRVKVDRVILVQKTRLNLNMEYNLEEPQIPLGTQDAPLPDAEAMIRIAHSNRKDIQASQALVSAAHWDVKKARSAYFPSLDFSASYGGYGLAVNRMVTNGAAVDLSQNPSLGSQLTNQHTFTYGLVMTWSLYDRSQTSTNVQQAKIIEKIARIDAEDAERQATVDVKQAVFDYTTALRTLDSTKAGLEAAQKAFEVIQERFKMGYANIIELTIAQGTMVQAQASRAQSVILYKLRKDALELASGNAVLP
jgi:outer membrane protein